RRLEAAVHRGLQPRAEYEHLDALQRHAALLPRDALAAVTRRRPGRPPAPPELPRLRLRRQMGLGRALDGTLAEPDLRPLPDPLPDLAGPRRRHVHVPVAQAGLAARDRLRRGVVGGRRPAVGDLDAA